MKKTEIGEGGRIQPQNLLKMPTFQTLCFIPLFLGKRKKSSKCNKKRTKWSNIFPFPSFFLKKKSYKNIFERLRYSGKKGGWREKSKQFVLQLTKNV